MKIWEKGKKTIEFSKSDLNLNNEECLYKECEYQPWLKRYVITLPFFDNYNQLPFDHKSSFLTGISWEHQRGVKIAIEELFYNFNKPGWILTLMKNGYFNDKWSFIWNKDKLWSSIQELISTGMVDAIDVYKNFEPLLQKIEAIIEESKK